MITVLMSDDECSKLSPYSDGASDFKGHIVKGEGKTVHDAITAFFRDLQSQNIDFAKSVLWRRLPELVTEKNFSTGEINYMYRMRLAVEK